MQHLVSLYGIFSPEPLKLALGNGHHGIVRLLCEAIECGDSLVWAAENGRLEAIKPIHEYHEDEETPYFYEAVLTAVSAGNLPIVQFVNSQFGEELYGLYGGRAVGGCPLTRAIEDGKAEIAKYLVENNGYNASMFEMAFSAAATYGPLKIVELMQSDERSDASLRKKGFGLAAGGGLSEVMEFFRSKGDFATSVVREAFLRAAGCGQTRILKQLYADQAHEILAVIDEAALTASGGGHLEVVKFFDNKGHVAEELVVKMFECAATDEGLKDVSIIDDQTGVLAYLHSKGWISVEIMNEVFPKAASCSCVEAVEFLLTTGPIFLEVAEDAFEEAAWDNCTVVEYFCKTRAVCPELIEIRGSRREKRYLLGRDSVQ